MKNTLSKDIYIYICDYDVVREQRLRRWKNHQGHKWICEAEDKECGMGSRRGPCRG